MSDEVHYVFVCQGKNCLGQGSAALLDRLRSELDAHQGFRVVPFICFGACAAAPNIAVFPDRLWYAAVLQENQQRVIEAILRTEEIPELSAKVSNDLKQIVFRMLGKPLRV